MANALTAYNPQWWANESVAILIENLVTARLIHMDFQNLVASAGDVVNTRKPAEFEAKRKTDADSITLQDASATNIQVKLDQHWHTSFILKDGEISKSFKDLRAEYLQPAIWSLAQKIDKVILGQWPQFMGNAEGKSGDFSGTTAKGYILDVHRRFNIRKVPDVGRRLLLNPTLEAEALKTDTFIEADKAADGGDALTNARLGRKFGFDIFMVQNLASVQNVGTDTAASAALVDNTGGYAAGASVIHVDTAGSALAVGQYIRFTDEGVWHRITALGTLATEDIDVTITPPLRRAIANDSTVTVGPKGAINEAAGYAAGYGKTVVVDGFTGSQVVIGSALSIAGHTTPYGVVEVTETAGNTTGVVLDRPLDAAVANDAAVYVIGNTQVGLAFDRPAMTMVSRPLALTEGDFGTRQAVANFNGFGLRAAMTYDPYAQGLVVTVDVLAGIKVLDANRGGVLFG